MISEYQELELIRTARDAREHSYAVYSHFKVGAALLTRSGEIFPGANVENLSFGLTICAERVCVGAAVAAGCSDFQHLAIVTDSTEPTIPCGACRQVLAEFSPDLHITAATLGGNSQRFTLAQLLPLSHQGIEVPRRT